MRIAYLDCFSGISGDMFLGALVDAGVSANLLEKTVAGLGIDARLEVSRVVRGGISATKVDMLVAGAKDRPRESVPEHQDRRHHHDHAQVHERVHEHHQEAGHTHHHEHPHRGLKEIREIIARAPISDGAKGTALAMFEALAAAEGKVHGISAEEVHFHEVGAADAICDIVCAAVGAEALKVDEWVASPLNVGSGTVICDHGRFPVPAPATVELLRGAPVYSSGIEAELVTPTGAAIVSTLASRFAPLPPLRIDATGYGAGARDFSGHANVVRITVGQAAESETRPHTGELETVTVLEANLDDLNPQVFGYVMDRALSEGALEVFGMPVQMKKNRPGMLLTVLARPADAERLAKLIFTETTTLGIRVRQDLRRTLVRRLVTVATPWGEVRMKLGSLNGSVSNFAPEYEDCRHLAVEHGIPLKTVMQEAIRRYLESRHG
ncbi:MAG: nickel pincer cofactor biosynthesis protein LarC [Acidobacteria bacterium]|nr:nickel pincer cofactor biosynthesis protein LarC [Acidobacteriota bacterium]